MNPRWMSLEATGKYVEFYALGANYSIIRSQIRAYFSGYIGKSGPENQNPVIN